MRDLDASFIAAVEPAFDHAMRDAKGEAVRRSSGPYSQPELNAMDNPFATRHARPLLDPSIVNMQRGVFRSKWHDPVTSLSGGNIDSTFLNDADVADFLRLGTKNMIPRPIQEEVEAYAEQELERRIRVAVRDWERNVR